LAHYLAVVHHWDFLQPLHGAVVAALASAITIAFVTLKYQEREDTIIGAIWAIGMAVGIIFIVKTPGYSENLMSYLFGNILLVSSQDLWLLGILDVVVIVVGLAFYRQITAVCFDDEFARVRGLNVEFYYTLLLCLTALTVVLLVTVVGIVMVIALLSLPAAVARHFSRTIWQSMIAATLLSVLFTTSGIAISYTPNLPAGATIILVAGGAFLLVTVVARLRKRVG
jgi:zinc transport system permease protein